MGFAAFYVPLWPSTRRRVFPEALRSVAEPELPKEREARGKDHADRAPVLVLVRDEPLGSGGARQARRAG